VEKMSKYGKFSEKIYKIVEEELGDSFTRAKIISYEHEIHKKFFNNNTTENGIN
jgi:hypothetical protein